MTKHIKIWALILCLILVVATFVACKKDEQNVETPTTAPNTEAPTTEAPTDAPGEEPTTEDPTTEAPTTEAPTEEPTECTHTGGTATCTAKAVCTACGESYGELNPENHAGTETTWTKTEATHKETYNCCNAVKTAEAAHTYVDGVCSVCEYACAHTGGTATCTAKAVCTACGESYGELNAANHVSTETTWTKTETTHKETYNCCGAAKVAEAAHTYVNGVCSVCEYACVHTGGEATCTDPAKCSVCNTPYGELDADNHKAEAKWITTALTHKQVYDCCGTVAVETEDHNWTDGVCSDCGYGCSHKGGEATCTAAAVCTLCGHSYGETNPANHTGTAVWTKTETSHKQVYDCCDAVAVAEEAHEWNNGVCYECVYTCKHTGGTATCTSRAICEICSKMYGSINADNHSGTPVWSKNETTHTKTYNCCGTDTVATEAHEWENGVCTECGWVCGHAVGVEATCISQATCKWCGELFGDVNPNNHPSAAVWTKTETTHKLAYDNCCGAIVTDTTAHEWSAGTCIVCQYVCEHTGGTAYCNEQATCEWCGEKYGNVNLANHAGTATTYTHTETTHASTYDCCGQVAVSDEAHEWTAGACTECEYVCGHTGGTATCSEKATCEWCGEKYGELAPDVHKEKTAATCLNKAVCEWCNNSYGNVNPDNHEASPDWTTTATTHSVAYTCCGTETAAPAPHNWIEGACSECNYACLHTEEATEWTKTETTHKSTYVTCGGVVVAEEPHEWGDDNVCDECGWTCAHFGGAATCIELATCEWCGAKYGSTVPENHAGEATTWTKTETTHKETYNCCGAVKVAEAEHTGGTAYCNAQAVCSVCGTAYGSTNASNHASTEFNITYVNETTHYYRYKCCNDVAKGEGHSFNNDGICVCGYEDPTMLNTTFLSAAASSPANVSASATSENGFNYAHLTVSGSSPVIDLFNANKTYNRYMLIRYRGNGSGYGGNYDCFFNINGTKYTGGGKGNANWFNLRYDNTWHYIIVDLGTADITSLTWTLFDGSITAAKGNWLDIEYIKFFDSYSAAKSFETSRHPEGNIYPFFDENGSNNTAVSNVPIGQIYYATNANGFASGAATAVPSSGTHLTMDWGFMTANGGYKIIVTVAPGTAVAQGDIGIQINNNDIEWGVSIVPAAGTYWCFANIADRVSLNQVNTLRVVVRNANSIAEEPVITLASYTITVAG